MSDLIYTRAAESITTVYTAIDEKTMQAFLQSAQLIHVSRGDILVREGQYSDKTWFVVEGALRAGYLKNGRDITDWFAFETDFVNSIQSYFLNVPSPHFIQALEPSVLLSFSRDETERLCIENPSLERLIRVAVTRSLLRLQQRISGLQFETAQQKLENLLAIHPSIMERIQLTHIASYLGITLETLSRLRKTRI